jgi:hypothetical protein
MASTLRELRLIRRRMFMDHAVRRARCGRWPPPLHRLLAQTRMCQLMQSQVPPRRLTTYGLDSGTA